MKKSDFKFSAKSLDLKFSVKSLGSIFFSFHTAASLKEKIKKFDKMSDYKLRHLMVDFDIPTGAQTGDFLRDRR